MILMVKTNFKGPVVLAVLDGVGLAPHGPGNAVSLARTPFLHHATKNYLYFAIEASGTAVGLLPGQMGNSEVGHNTMGCGQIIQHGIAHINTAFQDGSIWQSPAWHYIIDPLITPIDKNLDVCYNKKLNSNSPPTLHFSGIFSDGGVHSHLDHLEQMITVAYQQGVRRIRIHAVFDGRDVAPQSAHQFINRFHNFIKTLPNADIKIASGGGRMTTTADRYNNDWSMVKRGFDMMVHGIANHSFSSALEAISTFRHSDSSIQDQYLPSFVVVDSNQQPIGKIQPGDSLIYFDFRADRAIEITRAFTEDNFTPFSRSDFFPSQLRFAGLTEYDSDAHLPTHQLIPPIKITHPLNQFLSERKISQFAISETAKFGHITYYFNGNSHQPATGEKFQEIPSDSGSFHLRPWMKTAEITDAILNQLSNFQFLRLNFPGGDMVGHSAHLQATVIAIEAIDLALSRLATKIDELGGCLVITADHGNAEELLDSDGLQKTAHTSNLVPFILYHQTPQRYLPSFLPHPGLANLASTIALLLGQTNYPSVWQPPLIKIAPS